MKTLLVAQVLSTVGMAAVIWFVQLVHYPLFAMVGAERFAAYEAAHQSRISLIVIPLMLVELGTAGALALTPGVPFAPPWERWLGLGLVLAVWGVTFLFSAPAHGRLGGGLDLAALQTLVLTNWLRTAAWTGRGGLVTLWLWRALA